MCATVSRDSVHRPTRQPSRAAAYAASTPAWPAPITMTSKRWSFPDAEPLEDVLQQVVARARADDLVEPGARGLQIGQHELLRRVPRRPTPCARRQDARAPARAARCGACWRSPRCRAAIRVPSARARSRGADRRHPRLSLPKPRPLEPAKAGRHVRSVRAIRRGRLQPARARSLEDRSCSPRRSAVGPRSVRAAPRPRSGSVRCDRAPATARSATSRACSLRATPSRSTTSCVSRHPAVSTSVTARPSMSTRSDTRSRVVPATRRDDGAVGAGEHVEQARLADIWPARDHDRRPLANHPARARAGEQLVEPRDDARRSGGPLRTAR